MKIPYKFNKATLNFYIAIILLPCFLFNSCVTQKKVTINTTASGAEISVDGTPLGTDRIQTQAPATMLMKVGITHPDYEDMTFNIKPIKNQQVKGLQTISTTLGVFGLLFGGMFYLVSFSSKGPTDPAAEAYEGMKDAGFKLALAGGGLLTLGLIPFYKWNDSYTFNDVDISPYLLYDNEGYHKQTGFNHFGVNRNGHFIDGSQFSGKIEKASKTGPGLYTDTEGNKFSGTFIEDLLQGFAIAEYTDGGKYLGNFKDSEKDGYGIYISPEKKQSCQTWTSNTLVSETPYPTKNPVIFEPQLIYASNTISQGLAEGMGIALSSDMKTRQEGIFSHGRLINGILLQADGSFMKGTFSNGFLTKGIFQNAEGTRWEGIWSKGKIQSPCSIISHDTVFSGETTDGVPDGKGTMKYDSGDKFTGTFHDGIPEGNGVYTFASGTIYEGDFVKGQFEGHGKLVKSNGESFDGEFMAGKPHGMGIYKDKNTVERAEYYEGKRIDQAYLIKEQREKDQIEKARQEELAEQQRITAENARRQELARQQEESKKKAGDNSAIALLGGLAAVVAGNKIGLSDNDAINLGVSVAKDIHEDTGGTNTLETTKSINTNMAQTKQNPTGIFSETPQTTNYNLFVDANSSKGNASANKANNTTAQTTGKKSYTTEDLQAARAIAAQNANVQRTIKLHSDALLDYNSHMGKDDDIQVTAHFMNSETLYNKYWTAYQSSDITDITVNKLYQDYYSQASLAISVWENFNNKKWTWPKPEK